MASLMLLGTLLVAILVAHSRHAAQIRGAQARLAALDAADRLLAKWSADGTWGATASEGTFDDDPQLSWRWTVVPDAALSRIGAAVGCLEVYGKDGQPLAQLELLAHGSLSTQPQ